LAGKNLEVTSLTAQKLKAHPQLKKIVNEIVMVGPNDAALPEARFAYWHAFLLNAYPREASPALYGQLLTMALKFAVHKCTAAGQLFVLSSLGLNAAETRSVSKKHGFPAQMLTPQSTPSSSGAFKLPSDKGVGPSSARHGKKEKK
jgi:hypothetical protein